MEQSVTSLKPASTPSEKVTVNEVLLVPVAAALFAVGSTASAVAHAQEKPLIIGTNNWAENVAVANLWKLVLDDQGYDVELSDVGKSALFAGLANGDFDLSLELWLPYTDKAFLEPYKDTLEVHDAWYDRTGLGLVVPSYVDIDSQLRPVPSRFADIREYHRRVG